MKAQNVCAIICTVISVISWLFGDNIAGRLGDKNMQKIAFAITMGFVSYFVLLTASTTIQVFLERQDKKRAEEKAATKFNRGFSQLRPEHVDVLRELWEKRVITRDEDNRAAVAWLEDMGMAKLGKYVGDNLVYKLTEKGEDVCDRLIDKDWTL